MIAFTNLLLFGAMILPSSTELMEAIPIILSLIVIEGSLILA